MSALPSAWASCTYADGFELLNITVPLSGAIVVPRDAPVGAMLATFKWAPANTSQFYASCSGSFTRSWTLPVTPYPAGADKVFPTNVPGIGVKITNQQTPFPITSTGTGSVRFYWAART